MLNVRRRMMIETWSMMDMIEAAIGALNVQNIYWYDGVLGIPEYGSTTCTGW